MGGYKREIHKKHYVKQLRLIYLIFSLNFQIVETQIKFMSIFHLPLNFHYEDFVIDFSFL